MRPQLLPSRHHQRLLTAAAWWLCTGAFLLITTLIPAHTALLGWTPGFWLLAAPLIVLLALEPPLLRRRRHRLHAAHAIHGVVWH